MFDKSRQAPCNWGGIGAPQKAAFLLIFLMLAALPGSVIITPRSVAQDPSFSGLNCVANPGFESGLKGWTTSSGCSITSQVRRSGSNSLEMKSTRTADTRWASLEFSAEPGRTCRIAAWIKTNDLSATSAGASVALSWLDAHGFMLGYSTSRALSGSKEWTYRSADVTIPRHARALRLTLITDSPTGTAWFDDVTAVVLDEVILRFLSVYPNYRGMLERSVASQAVFAYEVKGSSTHSLGNLALDVSILTNANQPVKTTQRKSLHIASFDSVKFDLSGLPVGTYVAAAQLNDPRTKESLLTRQVPFEVFEQPPGSPKVMIDRHNRCLVNGVPFFPIGLYSSGTTEDEIQLIADSKFNCLMDYAILAKPVEDIARYLNLLGKANIRTIFSLKDCYEPLLGEWTVTDWGQWKGSLQVLKGIVNRFKDHPALLAWYLNDEKEEPYIQQIRERYNLIKQIDTDHPTWQVLWPGQNPCAYVDTSDIIGLDVYPVWQRYKSGFSQPHLDQMGSETARLYHDTMRGRALWMVPECSSFKSLTRNSLPPTYEEMMCLASQCIVGGARGLVFYNFRELRTHDGEVQWQAAKSMAQSISDLEGIALGMDVPLPEQVRASDSRLSLITRVVGRDTWVLAVNTSHSTVPATFELPAATRSYRHIDAGLPNRTMRAIPLVGASFSDSIEPIGVRAYRLRE